MEMIIDGVMQSEDRKLIRKVMDKSGWGAHKAYEVITMLHSEKGYTYEAIVEEELWKEYKFKKADDLFAYIEGREFEDFPVQSIDWDAFDEAFYTETQKEALKKIKEGILTSDVFCDYLEIKDKDRVIAIFEGKGSDEDREYFMGENVGIEEKGEAEEDLDDDATDDDEEILEEEEPSEAMKSFLERISFRPNHTRKHSVYMCMEKKYVKPGMVKRVKPLCVVGYPANRKDFKDTGVPFVSCENFGSYMLDIAEIWGQRVRAKTVGISGSAGKTSTTDMIGLVTGENLNMFKITGNQNTTWQIIRFILNLTDDPDVYVQECSGSFPSQLERTTRELRPDIFVLTNVTNGHIERYGGLQQRLLYEKLAMDRNSVPGAVGIVNWDDPLLKNAPYDHKVMGFAMKDETADFFAESVVEKDGKIFFDVREKDGTKTPVVLNVCGTHNVLNALSAFGVGVALGIDRAKIAEALTLYKTSGVRQNLTWLGGRHVYLDCYSATEDSMIKAVATMETISVPEGNRKIGVIGDVKALGAQEEEIHRRMGRRMAELKSADEIFFIGRGMGYAYEEAKAAGMKCRHTLDRKEFEKWLAEDTKPGDLLCFKAGHKMRFQRILDNVFGTDFYLEDEMISHPKKGKDQNFAYLSIAAYGSAIKKQIKGGKKITVPSKFKEQKIRAIDRGAFKNSRVEEVVLPGTIKCIAKEAFAGCSNLKKIALPKSLRYVGPAAFTGCSSLEEIGFSKGVVTIEDRAFADCENLKKVMLPSSVLTIADDAFGRKPEVTICCPAGSYAEKWAKEKGLETEKYDRKYVDALNGIALDASKAEKGEPGLLGKIKRKLFGSSKKSSEAAKKKIVEEKPPVVEVPAQENNETEEEKSPAEKPFGTKIASVTNRGIEYYWKKTEKASGYEVYRGYDPEGPYDLVKVIDKRTVGTYIDSEFDHDKKEVFYRVRSFLKENDEIFYSGMTPPRKAEYQEELMINRDVTYMYSGSTRKLRAVFGWGEPEGLSWTSDNESVAVIDETGMITAVAAGECNITCTYEEESRTAISKVVVDRKADKPLTEIRSRYEKDSSGLWKLKEEREKDSAVIMMTGDMMCGRKQMEVQYSEEEGWNFNSSFEYVREITAASDFAIGNLETLLAPGWPYQVDETYINNTNNCNASPRYLDAVRFGGFDAVAMANNHNCDGGQRALMETVEMVDEYELIRTGVFTSAEDERFFVADINGIKIGFLAYMTEDTGFNGKDRSWPQEDRDLYLNVFTPEKAEKDIAECRAKGAEYVIVYMHWGKKNFRNITPEQEREAILAAEAGADYIVGANPHVLQEYRSIKTKDGRDVPCFYSVGNFQAFMNQIPGNRDSVIVRINIRRDENGKVYLAENGYIPCHTYKDVEDSFLAPVALGDYFNEDVKKVKRKTITGRIKDAIGDYVEML